MAERRRGKDGSFRLGRSRCSLCTAVSLGDGFDPAQREKAVAGCVENVSNGP